MPKDSGFLRTVSKAESLGQISREWVQMSINQTRGNREWAMQLLQNPQSILSFFLSPSGILEYQSPDQHKEVCFQKKKKRGKFKTADYRRKLNSPDKFSARN